MQKLLNLTVAKCGKNSENLKGLKDSLYLVLFYFLKIQ